MLPKKRRMYSNNGGSLSIWDQAQFFAPLKTTLVLSRGTGSPTYARATTAYVTDFEGLLKQVPSGCARFTGARMVQNLLTYTEDFSQGIYAVGVGGTGTGSKTPNYGIAPDGTQTACRYQLSLNGGTTLNTNYSQGGNDTPLGGYGSITAVGTLWLKSNTGSNATLIIVDGTGIQNLITITPEWKRYSFTNTGTWSYGPRLRVRGGEGTDDTVDVLTWHHQVENVTGQSNQNPSEYVSVGVLSAPYHGAGVDGVKFFDTENGNTVASNVVTEATGAVIADATLKGYFAEGQRQNRCIHAQDFTNAAWVSGGGGIAVTPNTAVAPDGTTTADTLTASGANGTLIQDLGVVASADKVGGLYLKRKTGTGNIDLTLDGGATWTTVAVTSSWLLLEKTQTLADEDFGIRIVTSGDAVYAWQGQVETAAFISSVIPTTTAAVTRNTDVLSYPSAGNISVLADYSMYAEWQVYADNDGNQNIIGSNLNYAAYFVHQTTSTYNFLTLFNNTGDSSAVFSLSGGLANVSRKGACARDSTNIKVVADGGTVVSASNGTETAEISTLCVGNHNTVTNFLFGNIRNVKIWTTAKTDAQLQALTT